MSSRVATVLVLALLAASCVPPAVPDPPPPHVVAVLSELGWCGGVSVEHGVLAPWHCVDHADRVQVVVGSTPCWAAPTLIDDDDLARLELGPDCPPVRFAESREARVGEPVRVLSPRGGSWHPIETRVSGYLQIGHVERYAVPWPGRPGDSGASLWARDGRCVGLVIAAGRGHSESVRVDAHAPVASEGR